MRIKEGHDYADAFSLMCSNYMSLMEGDTHNTEGAFELMRRLNVKLMRKLNVIDENDEMIEDEEEEEND